MIFSFSEQYYFVDLSGSIFTDVFQQSYTNGTETTDAHDSSGKKTINDLTNTIYATGITQDDYTINTNQKIFTIYPIDNNNAIGNENDVSYNFEGKNVLLVDDSIVRGTTSAQIVEMAREVGANKVYFASAAPPVRYPNVYGIDMPAVTEFIANGRTVDEIGETIGADQLFYQSLDDLIEVTSMNGEQKWDTSCFDGKYVTGDVSLEYLAELEDSRNDDAKKARGFSEETIDLHNDE